jgi:tRNA-specific 2-thiouridylase
LCVVKIDPENNILVADKWESLFLREFIISGYHFINPADLHKAKTIQVRVRGFGLNPPGNCRLEYIDDRHMKIYLDEPAWAVAPGQPAVFYSGDLLLGGGYVVESMV